MLTIHKYDIQMNDITQLPIPSTAKVLTVQLQGGIPRVWVLLDPNHVVSEPRTFEVMVTGEEITGQIGEYIGTFQSGPFVFHLFETTSKPMALPKFDSTRRFGPTK